MDGTFLSALYVDPILAAEIEEAAMIHDVSTTSVIVQLIEQARQFHKVIADQNMELLKQLEAPTILM